MVNYFNETSDVKINPNLLAELPNMEATYEAVKQHGLKSIEILSVNIINSSVYDKSRFKNRSMTFHVERASASGLGKYLPPRGQSLINK